MQFSTHHKHQSELFPSKRDSGWRRESRTWREIDEHLSPNVLSRLEFSTYWPGTGPVMEVKSRAKWQCSQKQIYSAGRASIHLIWKIYKAVVWVGGSPVSAVENLYMIIVKLQLSVANALNGCMLNALTYCPNKLGRSLTGRLLILVYLVKVRLSCPMYLSPTWLRQTKNSKRFWNTPRVLRAN